MIKPKGEVTLSESVIKFTRTFLAGSSGKGKGINYLPKGLLTSLKSLLGLGFNMFDEVCLQSKFNDSLEYQPVRVF